MVDQENLARLRLIRSENVGSRTFFSLLKYFKTAQNAIKRVKNLSLEGKLKKNIKLCSEDRAINEIEKTLAYGAELIFYDDKRYPALLKEISDYPPVITVVGKRMDLLSKDKVAIVGSRNATTNGTNFAYKIASEISENGYVTVSGLARGIDSYVHRGSFQNGTIAFMASGIDHIYPLENKNLYRETIEQGLVMTEQEFGSLPKAVYFPQRNRIISGLARAVVVIEAGIKSGSLITAKYAIEQNREVFAVPGFPLDFRYGGTNYLIKQGACLLEKSDDVLEFLKQIPCISMNKSESEASLFGDNKRKFKTRDIENQFSQKDLDKLHELVLAKLGTMPISTNQLVQELKVSIDILSLVLIELELAGKIARIGSNQIMLVV
ncbi:MAG: DNA-protecting protein DprA [Rickettsiales bacterium]|nr:DNA-protecting protein DprA [Rickettsiales bacterium]